MDSFSAMLAAHEGEDGRALSDGAVLEAVCREFANADEIIAEVRAEGIEVENYVCSDFSVATLQGFAAVYGYAPAYASRLIGAETGRSFSQIARSCRLKEARRLLAAGVSAEETASRVGYGSLSGFYRQFCAAYGMTPAGYAQLFR